MVCLNSQHPEMTETLTRIMPGVADNLRLKASQGYTALKLVGYRHRLLFLFMLTPSQEPYCTMLDHTLRYITLTLFPSQPLFGHPNYPL